MSWLKLIHVLVSSLNAVPYVVVAGAALILGRLGYLIYRPERELALQNIRTCYPEEPHSVHKRIAIRAFQHMAVSVIDLLRTAQGGPHTRPRVSLRNPERITESLKNGHGVILITGHYGNPSILPYVLEGLCDDPAYIMRRPTRRVGWVVAQFRAYRDEYLKPRSSFHSLSSSVRGAVSAGHLLKRGNLVLIVADLTWGAGEITLTFLGIPHNMSRAPASLSILTGASLIPVITSRNNDGSYEVIVEEPIKHPQDISRSEAERAATETFAKILEPWVKACPEQWVWTHRHGRHRPFNGF